MALISEVQRLPVNLPVEVMDWSRRAIVLMEQGAVSRLNR